MIYAPNLGEESDPMEWKAILKESRVTMALSFAVVLIVSLLNNFLPMSAPLNALMFISLMLKKGMNLDILFNVGLHLAIPLLGIYAAYNIKKKPGVNILDSVKFGLIVGVLPALSLQVVWFLLVILVGFAIGADPFEYFSRILIENDMSGIKTIALDLVVGIGLGLGGAFLWIIGQMRMSSSN